MPNPHEKDAQETLDQFGLTAQIPQLTGIGDWPKTGGKNILETNVHLTRMRQMLIFRYEVEITSPLPNGKMICWSRGSRNDYEATDRREHCRQALEYLCTYHADVVKADCIYHDLQSILYSTEDLKKTKFTIENVLDYNQQTYTYEVLLKGTGQITLNDFTTSVALNLDMSQRDLAHFIDIATSKYVFEHPTEHITYSTNVTYLLDPQKYGFSDADMEAYPECGAYLSIGAMKSTQIIEGAGGKGDMGLIISTKKTPFHVADCPLTEKIDALARSFNSGVPLSDMAFDRINKNLKGIFVYTNHQTNKEGKSVRRDYAILRLIRETSVTKQIDMKDQGSKTIAKYFGDRYNIRILKPNYNLVEAYHIGGRKSDTVFLPPELCYVCDNQRVTTNQLLPTMTQKIIKKCATVPAILKEQNEAATRSFHLDDGILRPTKMEVQIEPMKVNSSTLNPPPIVSGPNQEQARIDTSRVAFWQVRQYSRPGVIPAATGKTAMWVAYAILPPRDNLTTPDFERFLKDYTNMAKNRGLRIGDARDVGIANGEKNDLFEQLQQGLGVAAKNGVRFALVVHSEIGTSGDELHNLTKYFERKYSIITQCLKLSTVRKYLQLAQRLTLENIVNKTNMKLGGLNYELNTARLPMAVSDLFQSTLFIGIASNHPGGGMGMFEGNGQNEGNEDFDLEHGIPTVVGYSGNFGEHPVNFIGDMVFQVARREERVQIVHDILDRALDRYKETNKRFPSKVVIYRSGFSEGTFKAIIRYEVPLLQNLMMKKTGRNRVTMIVCNRVQNVRFFKQRIDSRGKAPEQNVDPGTVIDTGIVFPGIKEFFLNSHRTLQGTARIPKYTVLVDDNDLSLEQLENTTYHLCYCHQIVNMPTSLPSPVYIAQLYADRGRRMFQIYMDTKGGNPTFEELTQELSYGNDRILGPRRINA